VFYRWEISRAAVCLDNLIPVDFSGTVQCDGYSAYRAFANGRDGAIELAGCWAHVRRKFHEALEQSPKTAGWIMRQIQHLYRVEARLRESRDGGSGPRLRAAVRAHESKPIVERLERALIRLRSSGRHLPQSLLGVAIDYALGQWQTLDVYLDDGRVEIDNNLVENAIRPPALGKKNWLFMGDADAGERGAIIYTVIESCRRRGLDPYAYLKDVLSRLPRMTNHQIPTVTPAAWAKTPVQLQRQAVS
jgi:transposase